MAKPKVVPGRFGRRSPPADLGAPQQRRGEKESDHPAAEHPEDSSLGDFFSCDPFNEDKGIPAHGETIAALRAGRSRLQIDGVVNVPRASPARFFVQSAILSQ